MSISTSVEVTAGYEPANATSRSVAVLSTTRAESGITRWILQDLVSSSSLRPTPIFTGTHDSGAIEDLVPNPGGIDWVEPQWVHVPVEPHDGSSLGATLWVSRCMAAIATVLAEMRADIVLLVGDRIETLAAAQAASILGIPIAHLHGGELTTGALDERCRHAISKLADVHFVATQDYGRRLVQLGENPQRVFNVGAPGLCELQRGTPVSRSEVSELLSLGPTDEFILITYHPVTTSDESQSTEGVDAVLDALESFPRYRLVFTGINVDPGSSAVRRKIERFCAALPGDRQLIESLGHRHYLGALRYATLCVGNSSSGIIEAPAVQTPTVNVGPRQDGRARADSVFDVDENPQSISSGISRAIRANEAGALFTLPPPYGAPGASRRIVDLLQNLQFPKRAAKHFNDCEEGCSSWSVQLGGSP